MKLSSNNQSIHYEFSASLEPILVIESGQELTVETLDASNGQIRPGRVTPVDKETLLPATGPIAVAGAEPGDAIAVEIKSIKFAEEGYAWVRRGLGICDIEVEGLFAVAPIMVSDQVELPGGITIPLRPMVGIVGVATHDKISTRLPGIHGGNLDCVDIAPGNTLWLPVAVHGALLSLGDAHAAMGEGEVSGTGVEIDAEVTIKVTLSKNMLLEGPVVTTAEKSLFLASGATVELAAEIAFARAMKALDDRLELSKPDACMVASIAGNLKVCQLVNGIITVSYEVPRSVLNW